MSIETPTPSSPLPNADAKPVSRKVHDAVERAVELFDLHVSTPPAHGNQSLHPRGLLALLLSAAFEPAARSLRTIDDLSLCPDIRQLVGVDRVARSTLSDAMAKFDPAALDPLVKALKTSSTSASSTPYSPNNPTLSCD